MVKDCLSSSRGSADHTPLSADCELVAGGATLGTALVLPVLSPRFRRPLGRAPTGGGFTAVALLDGTDWEQSTLQAKKARLTHLWEPNSSEIVTNSNK